MATLTGSSIASTYEQLIKLDTETLGDDHSAKWLETGKAENLPIAVSTNRVGIGTASPNYNLEVKGDDLPTISLVYDQSDTDVDNDETLGRILFHGLDGDATQKVGASIVAQADGNWTAHDNNAPTRLEFYTQDGSDSTTLGSPRMTIEDGGNVGIGTSSPSVSLHVVKASDPFITLEATSDADAADTILQFKINNTDGGGSSNYIYFGDSASDYAGSIRYDHSTNRMTFVSDASANNLVLDDGKVGIGTASPSQELAVEKNQNAATAISVTNPNDEASAVCGYSWYNDTPNNVNAWYYGSGHSLLNKLVFTGNASPDVCFNTGGNVGIGTTSPAAPLEVSSAIDTGSTVGADADCLAIFENTSAADNRAAMIKLKNSHADSDNYFVWDSADDDDSFMYFFDADTGGSPSARMTIDSDGKVGIGTASPEKLLHLKTTAQTDFAMKISADLDAASRWTGIQFGLDHVATNYAKGGIVYEGLDSDGRGKFHFCLQGDSDNTSVDNATDDAVMTLQYNGNVGIGNSAPGELLTIGNITDNVDTFIHLLCDDGNDSGIKFTEESTNHWMIRQNSNADIQMYDFSDTSIAAHISPGDTAWQSESDLRIKKDIENIDSVLSSINSLRPITYKRKYGNSDRVYPGLIAQEAKPLLPLLTPKDEDKFK